MPVRSGGVAAPAWPSWLASITTGSPARSPHAKSSAQKNAPRTTGPADIDETYTAPSRSTPQNPAKQPSREPIPTLSDTLPLSDREHAKQGLPGSRRAFAAAQEPVRAARTRVRRAARALAAGAPSRRGYPALRSLRAARPSRAGARHGTRFRDFGFGARRVRHSARIRPSLGGSAGAASLADSDRGVHGARPHPSPRARAHPALLAVLRAPRGRAAARRFRGWRGHASRVT